MNRIMNSHYRTKDLFLNITDELEVCILSKSTQSCRLTLYTFILCTIRMDPLKCKVWILVEFGVIFQFNS